MPGESGVWTARIGPAAERLRQAFARGRVSARGSPALSAETGPIQIHAITHTLTVGRPQPDDLSDALDRIHCDSGAHSAK